MMDNTINGRTPDEIKRVLECCYGNKERRLCEKCPSACKVEGYSELICTDFDSSGENALAYIQQLERERDEAQEENDLNNAAITSLEGALDAMKRERDSAVVQLKEVDVSSYFECAHCKHEELCDSPVWPCNDCDNEECPCHTCSEGSNWQWRGVEEEKE